MNKEPTAFDGAYANRALILLSLTTALITYVDIMLTPALPTIASEYGVSIAQTSLVISLYTVFGVAVMPIIGKLGDIYGKKRVLVYTLVVYLVMATTTSFAPTFNWILVSRFFQGVGLGAFPLSFSLAREEFPRDLVPRAQGVISAVQVAGGGAGILGGAVVTLYYGWQANYHLIMPCIFSLAILTVLLVRESPNRQPGVRLDYVGAGWLGACLTVIVLGLSEGATWGWTSLPTFCLVIGGVLALIPLSLFESRREDPVLNLRLLRQRNIFVANLLVFIWGVSTYIAFQAITYYMQLPSPAGFGLDTVQTGVWLFPMVVVIMPVAYGIGTVLPEYGVKPFLYFGAFLAMVGFLSLAMASTPLEIGASMTIYAGGGGLMSVSIQNLLVLSLDKREMGLGTSLNTVFRYIGQSIGAPVSGAILSTYVTTEVVKGHATELPTHVAFQLCFVTAILLFVVYGLTAIPAHEVLGPSGLAPLEHR